MIVLGANKNRNRSFVEPPSLAVPLLDAIECAFPRQIEHEQDSYRIVANKWQHVDEFSLAAKIPYAERDFGVPDADCFLHEIDAKRLDIIFVPAAFDIFHHQRRLADLGVAYHPNLDDNLVTCAGLVGATAAPVTVRSLPIPTGTGETGRGS